MLNVLSVRCQLLQTVFGCTFNFLYVFLQKKTVSLTLLSNTTTSKNMWAFWKHWSAPKRGKQLMFWSSSILSERSGMRTNSSKSTLVFFDFPWPWHVPCWTTVRKCFHVITSFCTWSQFSKGIHGKWPIIDPHWIWTPALRFGWTRN